MSKIEVGQCKDCRWWDNSGHRLHIISERVNYGYCVKMDSDRDGYFRYKNKAGSTSDHGYSFVVAHKDFGCTMFEHSLPE